MLRKLLLCLTTILFLVFSVGCYGPGAELKRMVTGKEDFQQMFAHWCRNGNIELIEEFIENKKISQSTLNSGLYNTDTSEIRKILLDAGADPNYRDMLLRLSWISTKAFLCCFQKNLNDNLDIL